MRRDAPIGTGSQQILNLGSCDRAIETRICDHASGNLAARIRSRDASLWPGDKSLISHRLGWIDLPRRMPHRLGHIGHFVEEAVRAGFTHLVHLGMGGSSLTPLVLHQAFPADKPLALTVLDTTDPAAVLKIRDERPMQHTLFISASKSGTTAETAAMQQYFFRTLADHGHDAGRSFAAITDPKSPLAQQGRELGFRRVFLNAADVGGRYSALSYFGLVPASLAGVDVAGLLSRAGVALNNGGMAGAVALGATLGELARAGQDKVTLLLPSSLSAFGMWLEQLLAESTGKHGKGILPVAQEAPGDVKAYGSDRVFVHITLAQEADELSPFVESLEHAGHPVAHLRLADRAELGHQFLHWQLATAVAGAVLEINPFDEPNVKESKQNTGQLLSELEQSGQLPQSAPSLDASPLYFYGGPTANDAPTLLRGFLRQFRAGDYLALQVYLPEEPHTHAALQGIRTMVRDTLQIATTLGYGPRYLHSTGQLHKGGPDTGLFVQLTGDDFADVPVPGTSYSFGQFKLAQAIGDLQALEGHGRRVLRIHLAGDRAAALNRLDEAFHQALTP
ncbi:MAG: hypothetical protein ACOC6A_03270 [Chloroflexota bacterium]